MNDQVGILVPTEDADALAWAIDRVLAHRDHYSPAHLRAYALENLAWERSAQRTVALYHEALSQVSSRGLDSGTVGERSRA